MRTCSHRRAFSLVELLVVIAIIAILIALLLPAVQSVREAASITQCQNQLKQIGLAFHNHHGVHGVHPSGGSSWGSSTTRVMMGSMPAYYDKQSWGWAYQILPFLEQSNVWEESQSVAEGTVIATYFCPSVRPPVVWSYTQSGASTMRAMMDYVGNGGSSGGWSTFTRSLPDNPMDGPIVPSKSVSSLLRTVNHITDGLSNTLLVGEKYLVQNSYLSGPSCNDDQGYVDGWDNDAICFARGGSASNPPSVPQAFGGTGCSLIFGSIHRSMNAVFCDGSVHAISFGIDPNNWLNLCVINDGQAVILD